METEAPSTVAPMSVPLRDAARPQACRLRWLRGRRGARCSPAFTFVHLGEDADAALWALVQVVLVVLAAIDIATAACFRT